MKKKSTAVLIIFCLAFLLACTKAKTPEVNQIEISEPVDTATTKSVAVFYDFDTTDQWNYGKIYAGMVRNLLGHFDTDVTIMDVADYRSGLLKEYDAGIYIGNVYDYPLSDAFLQDVLQSENPFLWMNANVWQLFKNSEWGAEDKYGFQYIESEIVNPDVKIVYKGKELPRLETDVYFNLVNISAGSQCEELASLKIVGEVDQPYAIRCGNFFYITHNPLANFYASYLVFADLLHDLLDTQVAESHRAMVRFEDLMPGNVNYDVLKEEVDFLYSKGIPFSFDVIPVNTDPQGVWGEPGKTVYLYEDFMLQDLIKYMVKHGGTPVLHGYTHQHSTNTGADYEFWDGENDIPFPEDSYSWADGRIKAGVEQFEKAMGYAPLVWETPHYSASPNTYFALKNSFDVIYDRIQVFNDLTVATAETSIDYSKIPYITQTFPYQIFQSIYGLHILPENLGYLEEGGDEEFGVPPTPEGKLLLADMYSVVRDGVVSFMFHHWQPAQTLYDTVNGLEEMGYTFVSIPDLLMDAPAE